MNGVTTNGRLIEMGCAITASIERSIAQCWIIQAQRLVRRTLLSQDLARAQYRLIRRTSVSHDGGVLKYSMTVGSMPA